MIVLEHKSFNLKKTFVLYEILDFLNSLMEKINTILQVSILWQVQWSFRIFLFLWPWWIRIATYYLLFYDIRDCIWYYHVTQYTIHFITAFHILSYWRIPWMPHLYSEKNITLCRWYCPIKSLLSRKIHQRIINFRE